MDDSSDSTNMNRSYDGVAAAVEAAAALAGEAWTQVDDAAPPRRADVVRKPPPAKFAAIDVGTNSIHLVMAEISREGDFRIVGRDKEMVQLGKGGFARHLLTPRAMADGVAALQRFCKMAHLRGVSPIHAVATSAVREAHNGGDFVERVRNEVGLELHIISAEEEARLVYLAVRHAVDLGEADNLILDIGGGSIELIVGNARRPELLFSAKLGASRLAELFSKGDAPRGDDLKSLQKHVERELQPLVERIGPRVFARCIGTSGTVETLAAMLARRHGAAEIEPTAQLVIRRADLKALAGELADMSREQRLKIPGLDAKRADTIVPAAVLLHTLMRTFGLDEIQRCDLALREGVIIDYIGRHRAHLTARATWPDPRARSVLHLAERCGYSAQHAEQVARLAAELFDQLSPLHGLPAECRELLRYASLLHDVGYLISHEDHHKHSYYLIRNGGLAGFTEREVEIIANVARYHRKGRPRKSDYSYASLERADRPVVKKLLALLRLANALDRTHYSVVESIDCRIRPEGVLVLVHCDKDAELEMWTARRQGEPFERAFERPLEVKLAREEARAGTELGNECPRS